MKECLKHNLELTPAANPIAFIVYIICLILTLTLSSILRNQKNSTDDINKNFIIFISQTIFEIYNVLALVCCVTGICQNMILTLPLIMFQLVRYIYMYLVFCTVTLHLVSSTFKLLIIVKYEWIMMFDQESLASRSIVVVFLSALIIYIPALAVHLQTEFLEVESTGCLVEKFDVIQDFHAIIFFSYGLYLLCSNLFVKIYTRPIPGQQDVNSHFLQCSKITSGTIGAYSTILWLVLCILTHKRLPFHSTIDVKVVKVLELSIPLTSLILHILKESEFTFPYLQTRAIRLLYLCLCVEPPAVPATFDPLDTRLVELIARNLSADTRSALTSVATRRTTSQAISMQNSELVTSDLIFVREASRTQEENLYSVVQNQTRSSISSEFQTQCHGSEVLGNQFNSEEPANRFNPEEQTNWFSSEVQAIRFNSEEQANRFNSEEQANRFNSEEQANRFYSEEQANLFNSEHALPLNTYLNASGVYIGLHRPNQM